jgi:HD-GYP domain-containing protein (c-di-GMP phosphodiesterase class II)
VARAPARGGRHRDRGARLRALAIAALLHDVGKLGIPDSILKKPGPLDDDEYDVIRMHSLRV